jgi:hypothetical protein
MLSCNDDSAASGKSWSIHGFLGGEGGGGWFPFFFCEEMGKILIFLSKSPQRQCH